MEKIVVLLLITLGAITCCNFETPYRFGLTAGEESLASRLFVKRSDVHWHYSRTGKDGPSSWTKLNKAWPCNGKRQSPINIQKSKTVSCDALPSLKLSYPTVKGAVIHHNGHVIQADIPAQGPQPTIAGGPLGEDYKMIQFHFHSSSEHQLSGLSTIAEIHFVHQSTKNPLKLAVLGILLAEGCQDQKPDPFFSQFLKFFPKLKKAGDKQQLASLCLNHIWKNKDLFSSYYTYDGSLTTPPCNETVTWLVLSKPLQLSPAQAEAISRLIPQTNRPLQSLYNRKVFEGTEFSFGTKGTTKNIKLGGSYSNWKNECSNGDSSSDSEGEIETAY